MTQQGNCIGSGGRVGREQSVSQPGRRVMRGVIHLESYAEPLWLSRGDGSLTRSNVLPGPCRSSRAGPTVPDGGGSSIARGPRCEEASPRNLLVALPAQDLDLFHRLPARKHRRPLVMGLPSAPMGRPSAMLPDEVMRTAVTLMMGPPPTLTPGVGPHPGILNRFIKGHHGLPPWYGGTLIGMLQVPSGLLSKRDATVVPPPAQPEAQRVRDTHPRINAEAQRVESTRVGRRANPMAEELPYPKRCAVRTE